MLLLRGYRSKTKNNLWMPANTSGNVIIKNHNITNLFEKEIPLIIKTAYLIGYIFDRIAKQYLLSTLDRVKLSKPSTIKSASAKSTAR